MLQQRVKSLFCRGRNSLRLPTGPSMDGWWLRNMHVDNDMADDEEDGKKIERVEQATEKRIWKKRKQKERVEWKGSGDKGPQRLLPDRPRP